MRKFYVLLLTDFFVLATFACSKSYAAVETDSSGRNIVSNESDLYEKISFNSAVLINLNDGSVKYSGSANSSNISVISEVTGISIESTLDSPLKIQLTGTLDGTFSVVKTTEAYAIELNGVTITAIDGPALNLLSKNKVFILATNKSTNVLTDSTTRTTNTKKAAVFASGAVIFPSNKAGNTGSITVNGGYKNGLYSDDYIRVIGGTLSVNVSARDAIRCINGFIMDDGLLSIKGTGASTDDESRGIKVDGQESVQNPNEGFIIINGGTINSRTVGKGITAGWKIAEDAETTDTSDDPNSSLTVNGGLINITTTGIPYEKKVNGTTVSLSPEGLEAKNILTINGGNITLHTTDDCINAGNAIVINGGTIDVLSTMNDAIDSNGILTINGGLITAVGAQTPETAFDCDQNEFQINGGTVIGYGGANLSMPSTRSKQNIIVWYSNLAKGTTITIKNASGKEIISQILNTTSQAVVLSSDLFKTGETYTLLTSTGSSETATINTSVTTVGTGGMGGRGMGGRMPQGTFDGQNNFGGRGMKGNKSFPEGMTPPDGMTPADGMMIPDGEIPPDFPNGFEPPDGMTPPDKQ